MAEALTRATIWLSLSAYFVVRAHQLSARTSSAGRDWVLGLWAFGCAAYVAHVVSAFQFYHHWSHENALTHTAEATAAVTGWRSGAGLYVNYAFTLAWLLDVIWWWIDPDSHTRRPRWVRWLWHGF